ACEQVAQDPEAPPRITSRRGRPRQVDTAQHFCPHATCDYRGWMDWGNISANGHPSGGPWRQLYCSACERYVLETHGTPCHGKRVAPDLLVWAVGALAEGLGIRAVARVFAVDPNTVLAWLLEVADHLKAFSQYFLRDVCVTQVQLDELYALLSAVKDGEVSAAEAMERLERSPQWVWVAMDPESKLLLALDVGERTLAMAQCVVHHVAQVVAPDCVPLFLTDGFREYLTALLTHFGHWVHPHRRQAPSPLPKPRWMPLPQLPFMRKWSRPYGAVGWCGCATAWCSAPWRRCSRCWPYVAGRSTPPSWSGSTSPSGSMWRRWDGGSPRSARAKTGCGSNWRSTIPTITSAYRIPPYACHFPTPKRRTAPAPPNAGSRGHPRWRRS